MQIERFSDRLDRWALSNEPKTLNELMRTFHGQAFAVALLLLMFLPALPLPTGGVSHVFEVISMLIAAQLILGRRHFWIPKRWRSNILPDGVLARICRWVRSAERLPKLRVHRILREPLVVQLIGLILFIFCFAAFVAPPFTGLDTLPAIGVVLMCLGMIFEDALFLLFGVVVGVSGIIINWEVTLVLLHSLTHLRL